MDYNSLFLEFGHFYEVSGEMYCVKEDCSDCKFVSKCKNFETKVCTDSIIPVRSIIKLNNKSSGYIDETNNVETKFHNGRLDGNIIPNSNKRVYKIIKDIKGVAYKNREIPFIFYSKKKWVCIRQMCSSCEYNKVCERDIEVRDAKDVILVMDISAQEPRSFTLSTKVTGNIERIWLRTFANDSIKKLKSYNTLKLLFDYNNINTVENPIYEKFLDETFFYDKTLMYKLQYAVNNHYNKKTDESRKYLESVSNEIIDLFRDFEARASS